MFEEKVAHLNKVTNPVAEKRGYSIAEIQQILGVCRPTAYALMKQNLFKTVKVGRITRIIKSSFDKWLNEIR